MARRGDPEPGAHPGRFLADTGLLGGYGASQVVARGISLTNGLGFSPDGATLYHSDSRVQTIWRYDVRADGTLSENAVFAKTTTGAPDGLAVAEDGSVWVALAGGGVVAVFGPDGAARSSLPVPQPMVTSVCFGGPDRRQLYIVTGSEGADGDNAGSVFVEPVAVPGLPVAAARVRLPVGV